MVVRISKVRVQLGGARECFSRRLPFLFARPGELIGCLGITMPSQRVGLNDQARMTAAVRDSARELSELLAIQI